MPSKLPSILAPYFDQFLARSAQVLVTSVLNASANWLIVRLTSVAVYGQDREDQARSTGAVPAQNSEHAILVSFLQSLELWLEIGKKANLDLAALIASRKFAYIDGLEGGIGSHTPTSIKTFALKSHSLSDILASITAAKQSLESAVIASSPTGTIILDGLDFVLASRPDINVPQLSAFLLTLQQSFAHVVITTSSDLPLLHNTDAASTPLEVNHGMFLRLASYQSSMLMQVRPLDTGFAQDVSGVIRISKGGQWTSDLGQVEDVPEGEWLYQLKGDGSIRVWSRGE